MAEYYAHRRDDGAHQTVLEHLECTAKYARRFGVSMGMEDETVYAAMLHDIGKFSKAFQLRLEGDKRRVDHATAGAREAYRAGHPQSAFAIAGHHAGLADYGDPSDSKEGSTLSARLKCELEDYAAFRTQLTPNPPPPLRAPGWPAFFLQTHMLFSALVDADWLDTERFMSCGSVERGMGTSIESLFSRFTAWIGSKGWTPPAEQPNMTLDQMRSGILFQCMNRAALDPGLFTLTVPTGGGKTTASLAFALAHALRYGLERIIYVIPYTSIIDQTAKKFRKILGDENVLEHHSQVAFDPDDDQLTPAQKRLQLATENWDAPVIVTTSVQFFESLFAHKKARSRKVHHIANSVVIFDEAQMLPIPYLLPCVAAIALLARDFHVSAVLCTATQPNLNDYLRQYTKQPVRELAPEMKKKGAAFRRTTIPPARPLDDEALVRELNAHSQVLCIVNARRHAQALFESLNPDGAFMLSTLLYPADRARKLAEIRARLLDGRPCRVVSTSLIEAGVDVDFPAVYRALAGLDSILQAAGRCNREGRRAADESIVTVFIPEQKQPRTFAPNIEATTSIVHDFFDPTSPEAIAAYFEFLYRNRGKAIDEQEIMKLIDKCAFREISNKFRLIEDNTRAVYVLFRDETARALETRLRAGERSRGLFRALGQYAVNVYDRHFRALYESGALTPLGEDIWLVTAENAYGEKTGLTLEPSGGEGYFA